MGDGNGPGGGTGLDQFGEPARSRRDWKPVGDSGRPESELS
jgi:hypothetical protein